MCKVIHMRDRMQGDTATDVYIGRAGHGEDGYFGNPHQIGYCNICNKNHDRADCIAAFKVTFWKRIHSDPEYLRRVRQLENKRLVCFCKPQACHGDVIKAWLDAGCPM